MRLGDRPRLIGDRDELSVGPRGIRAGTTAQDHDGGRQVDRRAVGGDQRPRDALASRHDRAVESVEVVVRRHLRTRVQRRHRRASRTRSARVGRIGHRRDRFGELGELIDGGPRDARGGDRRGGGPGEGCFGDVHRCLVGSLDTTPGRAGPERRRVVGGAGGLRVVCGGRGLVGLRRGFDLGRIGRARCGPRRHATRGSSRQEQGAGRGRRLRAGLGRRLGEAGDPSRRGLLGIRVRVRGRGRGMRVGPLTRGGTRGSAVAQRVEHVEDRRGVAGTEGSSGACARSSGGRRGCRA